MGDMSDEDWVWAKARERMYNLMELQARKEYWRGLRHGVLAYMVLVLALRALFWVLW